MFYFSKYLSKLVAVFLLVLIAAGCEDYTELDIEPVPSGDADFSNYVAVGNSLTAGFQNSALYESGQEYSFPNLLARQMQNESFSQPLISDPGIGGRIELTSLNPTGVQQTSEQGEPINQDDKPFDNLGIPAALLVDYANPQNSGNLSERATDPTHPAFNPFYGIVLESSELAKDAPNIHNQVAKQEPSFITFWLGNNDVLGFVTSGGEGQDITDPGTFNQLYQASAQLLVSTGADVVVYNIPDVTSIPFVFLLKSQLEEQEVITFNDETQSYQLVTPQGNLNIYIETDDGPRVMRQSDFLILSAQTYFGQVQAGNAPPPIQPDNAIPDNFVLDGPAGGPQGSSELEQAAGAVAQYNATIQTIASSSGFALVDINNIFNSILAEFSSTGNGYTSDGVTLRPVPGSLFSFDGIHPSNRGSAVIANETIKVINDSFGSNLDLIRLRNVPEGLPVSD